MKTQRFSNENYPGSAQTQVTRINNGGKTVGFYITSSGETKGFQHINGVYTNSNFPGTPFNELLGQNDQGQSVGYSTNTAGTNPGWLNQADIAISLFSRQCVGRRRIGDRASLRRQIRAWSRRMNHSCTPTQWNFTRNKARDTFDYTIRGHGTSLSNYDQDSQTFNITPEGARTRSERLRSNRVLRVTMGVADVLLASSVTREADTTLLSCDSLSAESHVCRSVLFSGSRFWQ